MCEQLVTLQYQHQLLQIAPSVGGAITRYAVQHKEQYIDFLRPASEQSIASGEVGGMASFLMAPWAGRIWNGCFNYRGTPVHYPSPLADNPHSMHGFTKDYPWEVSGQSRDSVSLLFHHQATSEWPFSFVIEQHYLLNDKGLVITIKIENVGQQTMPFSLGHHPFFPCDKHTKIYTQVQQAWYSDVDLMPIRVGAHPLTERLAMGYPIQEKAWDIIFTHWNREVYITWENRSLRYQVSEPLNFFVLYNPAGESWFCAEPFGNITNSFNLQDQFPPSLIGGWDMKVGEKMQVIFTLYPSFKVEE